MQFQDKDNQLKYMYQTSWGMTTRVIGALIMVHGDDSGLKLPPHIAPTQVVVVPIQMNKEGVLDRAGEIAARLRKAGVRVKVDDTDRRPGFKFADSEMRGIPLRIEIGPKDIEAGQCVLVRRDTHEKTAASLAELEKEVPELLERIQGDMFRRAEAHRDAHTYDVTTMDEFAETVKNRPGFIRAMWCGSRECEEKIKEMTGATSRCIPFKQEKIADRCVCCGKPASKMVYWGIAY